MRRTAFVGITVLALALVLAPSAALRAQANRGAGDLVTAIKKAIPAGETPQIVTLLGELGPKNNVESVRFLLGLGPQIAQLPAAYDSNDRVQLFEAIKTALAASQDAAAQREVLSTGERGQNPNQRVVALEAIAATRWDGADAALTAAVRENRSETVRRAGVRALAARRSTSGIPAMIEALEQLERDQGTAYWEIHDALREITGQQFADAAGWKNFWRVRGKDFNPETDRQRPQTGQPAGGAHGTERPRGPQLFGGSEVSSHRVVFVVDVSGSMHHKDPMRPGGETARPRPQGGEQDHGTQGRREGQGGTGSGSGSGSSSGSGAGAAPGPTIPCHDYPGCTAPTQEGLPDSRKRIERVKREFTALIQALPQNTLFNLITFSTDVKSFQNKTLVPANAANKADAIRFVEGFKDEGCTNTYDAMVEAFANEQADTIYLLSDGSPTPAGYAGGQLSDEQYRALKDSITATVREKNLIRHVKIHTLGFNGADPSLMQELAEIGNHGSYREIP